MTLDDLHLHVAGYRRQGSLTPPAQGAAYHPRALLMYTLRDVLADGEHQAPNADVAWPEPLRPRSHAPTLVWLVTTDDQSARATEQAQLRTEWAIVQVGSGKPRPRGLPRGTTLLVATAVPHDPHMAMHTLEDQAEDTGQLVVHQRGGPGWLRERLNRHRYRQGWRFLTLWEGFEVEEAPWEPFSAFVLPEGRVNSVLVDHLSQNNLEELLSLAETLASQKKPRD